jgi:hypothetical protein
MTAPTAAGLRPLEPGAEWRRADVADPSTWVWQLSSEEVEELDGALRHARARRDDVLDVTRDDFPLPTMSPRLDALAAELIDGRGFALIRGLPVERYSDDEASTIYWGVGMHLGLPWPQNKRGHLLGDVTDQGKRADDPTSRGNEIGGLPFPFHSDGSDLVGLFCLRTGAEGGTSLVANALAAHNELVRTRPELAAALYEAMPYDYRGEQAEGSRPYYTLPVFTEHADRLFVRYIRPYIQAAMRHPEVPRLTPEAVEAMDALDATIGDPEFHVGMDFEPGDMQFVNNYHVLHGRTAYTDDPASGRRRHLKRLWLETSKLPDKPAYFRLERSAQHWWAEAGRTKSEL